MSVGSRIRIEQDKGTVRWRGELDGGHEWIGVEWDAAEGGRGKHDGVLPDGRRLFTPQSSAPQCASFLRVDKARFVAGQSIHAAVSARYLDADARGEDDSDMYVMSVRNKVMAVELVGKDKAYAHQAKLDRTTMISLLDMDVATYDERLAELCPNLEELDVSQNLLADWAHVCALGGGIPALRWLNASFNRFQFDPVGAPLAADGLAGLRVLILNNTGITWEQAKPLGALPALAELHLCGNGIATVSRATSPGAFAALEVLVLDDNPEIDSWGAVADAFGELPALQRLALCRAQVTEVRLADPEKQFCKLEALSLTGSPVADWASIDELNRFAALHEARLQSLAVTADHSATVARLLMIARANRLTSLNGSAVRASERVDAEQFYLRRCLQESQDREALAKEHPRFPELYKLYADQVGDGTQSSASLSNSLASEMCKLKLRCRTATTKAPEVEKPIPASLTVERLKMLTHKLFQLPLDGQLLFLERGDGAPFPEPLDDDRKPLSFYGVGDNCTVLVDVE